MGQLKILAITGGNSFLPAWWERGAFRPALKGKPTC